MKKKFLIHKYQGMYAIWCAKEALYKYYGLKSLDFKEHLKVDYQPLENEGTLTGYIQKDDYYTELKLGYEFFNEYLLIHTT